MATGTFDGVRELRSRLPDVPDTIIAYYLSKYNVEECYEKLKNGYDESADNMDSEIYNSQVFEGPPKTNAQLQAPPDTRTAPSLPQDTPWGSHTTQNIPPQELSPSHFRAVPPNYPDRNLPYPSYDDGPYDMPRSPVGERRQSEDLVADQRKQVDYIRKIRDLYTYDLAALRADAENKRHTLTALRLEVSEGPTRLDIAGLQDIITTLEYDIQTLQNKVQVEKTQAEMKEKLDVYTEEGVRWNCLKCGFLNHPLMTRCEHCDQIR